jgi:hypothetical protein
MPYFRRADGQGIVNVSRYADVQPFDERVTDIMVMKARILAAIGFACVIAIAASAPASAAESSFLNRFKGNWTGAGTVTKDALSVRVSCKAVGQPGDNRIVVQGNCGVAIISRPMVADLTYDPASGRYSGTYIGAKVGPARLTGTRSGNVVKLTITYPKPVNGDTKATLVIENAGSGSLRIMINDRPAPGAPMERTSDLVLSQL